MSDAGKLDAQRVRAARAEREVGRLLDALTNIREHAIAVKFDPDNELNVSYIYAIATDGLEVEDE